MLSTPVDVRAILYEKGNADLEYRMDLGHTKRFIERWHADRRFREMLPSDPRAVAARYGLVRDPEDIRLLWDLELQRTHVPGSGPVPLSVRRYTAFTREKIASREEYRVDAIPTDQRFAAWRARQIARCVSHLGGGKSEYVVHAPFCVELSKGCSVGCWFCSVGAPELSERFAYDAGNARLWRECLSVLRGFMGRAARKGFCYWASDPLDNPDYEQFLLDFHDILGEFPQTTTAQADRHVHRVRALLRLSEEKGGRIDRFSVITLAQWDRIHASFPAEETVYVECIPQNKEAWKPGKAIAGRAFEANRKRAGKQVEPLVPPDRTSTTACVSGFLLNMVDRTVRLVTPCHADTRWPLGYWIVDHGTFQDASGLRRLIEGMIDRHMSTVVGRDQGVRFRRDLAFEWTDEGFAVATRYRRHAMALGGARRAIGELVRDGALTAAQIALRMQDEHGVPMWESLDVLNRMRDGGLLDEEPAGAQDMLGKWIPAPMTTWKE